MLEILLALASLIVPTDSVEILFAGDAMQHQRQIDAAMSKGSKEAGPDYSDYFSSLTPYIQGADYAVVNLETPLGGAPYSGYPMFCAPDNYLTALTDAGFDLMLTANNHILDRRDKGLIRTIETFENRDVDWIGVYRDAAHRSEHLPFIRDIGGFKVAFLNYTYGTNGITRRTPVEIDYIDKTLIASDVKRARDAGAELIAVCIHWGDEYKLLPNATQMSLAEYIRSLGVEMIIGGHPHVIQPMELQVIGGKPTLTVYSLGNFISAMRTPDTRGGAMVRVKLKRDILRRPYVSEAAYKMVFVQEPQGRGDNFRLLPVGTDSLASASRMHHDNFARNARRIFDSHNINVPEDK